jgi:hypothetical protein
MAILYDYLTLVGDTNWYAAPAAVVSTKNVEAIRTSSGSSAPLTGPQVVSAAQTPPGSSAASPPAVKGSQPATGAAKSKTVATKKSGGE